MDGERPPKEAEAEYIRQLLEENPLVKFSVYTHFQAEYLRERARRIVLALDAMPHEAVVSPDRWRETYSPFWLWTLGAFEVVRTISSAKGCFSPELTTQMTGLKRQLVKLRVPFAKQERAGQRGLIEADASVIGFGPTGDDLLFEVGNEVMSARELMVDFERVFASVRSSDILHDYRELRRNTC